MNYSVSAKTLLLMRHAKSDWSNSMVDDFHRPLNKRGRKDIPGMARLLKCFGPMPDRILASPAVRAHETAEGIASEFRFTDGIQYEDQLYLASAGTLIQYAINQSDHVDHLLLIAHNPGMEECLQQLCGCHARFPTGAIACVASQSNTWSTIGKGSCTLQWFAGPQLVRALLKRHKGGA